MNGLTVRTGEKTEPEKRRENDKIGTVNMWKFRNNVCE